MGIPTLISTATADDDANVSITSGIDGTYDEYMFVFTDIAPASDNVKLGVNFSIDGGSNYNVTKTTTYFTADHAEDDGTAGLQYVAAGDLAQGTGVQILTDGVSTGTGDESAAGILHLFSPSNTTYVKHFYSTANAAGGSWMTNSFTAGYCNTTSAVNAVQFAFASGNMDGVIQLYGIS